MLESVTNMWTYPDADAICVTTNGEIKADGLAVMGAGCAAQARLRYPGIDFNLAEVLRTQGNVPAVIWGVERPVVVSFPTKHQWRDLADTALIQRSSRLLMLLADMYRWRTIVVPRPGAGKGRLDWRTQIQPLVEPLLDDRFVVVSRRDER